MLLHARFLVSQVRVSFSQKDIVDGLTAPEQCIDMGWIKLLSSVWQLTHAMDNIGLKIWGPGQKAKQKAAAPAIGKANRAEIFCSPVYPGDQAA